MGFLSFFKPKPKYVPIEGDGSRYGCWCRGDLAVCIRDNWTDMMTGELDNGPAKGLVLRVNDVKFILNYHALAFDGWPAYYTAGSFRKAVIEKQEACEEDFVTLLKRIRPKVDA